MGLFDFVKRGAQELFIARPDEAKDAIVYKWPDRTIPNRAQITVGQDEIALFYKDGKQVGKLDPGRHTLDAQNIPFLSLLIDKFTGGNAMMAEVWFITLRECAGKRFGGRIGAVQDPKSGIAIDLMVNGFFSIQADDPLKVIGFFGQRSWSTDEEFEGWFGSQLLKVARDRIAELLVKQQTPILNLPALTEEIEQLIVEGVKPHLDSYGMRVVRLGNFNIVIKPEDDAELKKFYNESAAMDRAAAKSGGLGAYQQYAAAKAMMGAGEGMAKGGGDGGNPMLGGAGMGIGFGMASMFQQQANQAQAQQQQQMQQAQQAPGAGGQVACSKCGAHVNPGKFCSECGNVLAEKKQFCSECGKPMTAGSKFCAECGAKAP